MIDYHTKDGQGIIEYYDYDTKKVVRQMCLVINEH